MRVYFDYNATTPLAPEVVDTISQVSRDLFGNPSSIHHFGQQAKATIDDARSATASLINADPSEIVFVSGGTEADNFAIRGAAEALEPTGRRHLIASGIEHEAVLNTLRALARRGWRTTLLPVDQTGVVSPDRLREAIDAETALVSVMHANNEIGTIQPVAALAAIAHEHGALMHTDAVQTAGKVPVDVRALGVDLLSLSAHKFNGPKGAGALWIKRGTRMQPTATGGKHERNRRAGTENVAAIAGLGVAAGRLRRGRPAQVPPEPEGVDDQQADRADARDGLLVTAGRVADLVGEPQEHDDEHRERRDQEEDSLEGHCNDRRWTAIRLRHGR
jgi:cysteine desulfurase